jgi:signal transduction histidine kinase/CheY-like chemotaxis protein
MEPPPRAADDSADLASLIALLNEDLADSRALHELSLYMLIEHEPAELYIRIAEAARQLLRSDFASLQMLCHDPNGRSRLDLIAHRGFTPEAADHWRHVYTDSMCTCGIALATGNRIIVSDVEASVAMAGTKDLAVYRAIGIRAVQTIPLRARDGTLIGMLSTHWARVCEPDARQLRLLDILAREAADLMERARDEALLRESAARLQQMDRMKDQFLATLAHELRNPLAPIRSGLQILRLNQTSEGTARVFGMLDRQLDHMVRLVDDLMEVARINSGAIQLQRQRIRLGVVLEAALELSRPALDQAAHAVTVAKIPGSLCIDGDEVRLAQVFSNLINNAARYTPPGGNIDIGATLHGDSVSIHVTDSGIGFSADEQALLFTLFGRLQPQSHSDGLGIGLALAKKLVELHGGSISARSEGRDKGSCFTVSLPAYETVQAPAVDEPSTGRDDFNGLKVLVVDDNRDAADSLAELLRLLGCEALAFHGAAEALEALERFEPAIALVDLGMPDMDGYEFAAQFRSRPGRHATRLVALTGWGQPEDRARSDSAGFDRHLIKPVSLSHLIELLREGDFDGPAA